jgi:hypothetical protein
VVADVLRMVEVLKQRRAFTEHVSVELFESDSSLARDVEAERLVSDPESFDGKRIAIVGLFREGSDGSAGELEVSTAEVGMDPGSRPRFEVVSPLPDPIGPGSFDGFSEKRVRVEGLCRFRDGFRGAGSIERVTLIEARADVKDGHR